MDCYAAGLGDCAGGPTKEHYVSSSVLELVGNKVRVSGFPWQQRDEAQDIGISALASKILCAHHNSELSPLDNAGKEFLSAVKNAFDEAADQGDFTDESIPIEGDLLELWFLKVLCGILAVSQGVSLPVEWVEVLFRRRGFDEGHGIHFFGVPGPATWYFNLLRVIPSLDKGGKLAGARFGVGGLAVLLAFGEPQFEEPGFDSRYRPESLMIHKGSNTKKLAFSWGNYEPTGSVFLRFEGIADENSTLPRPIVLPNSKIF